MNKVGVIIDLEGTLMANGMGLPDSIELLNYLKDQEIPFRILTNTASKSLKDLSNRFEAIGIHISEHWFINPIVVLNRFLKEVQTDSFYFVGPADIKNSLEIIPGYPDVPEYVVLCDFESNCSYELLNTIFTYLKKGSQLLTMSNSQYYLSKEGPKIDTGAFSKMFEALTQSETILLGKPSQMIYKEALMQMGLESNQVFAIGDDILTDIQGALGIGASTVLVKTGKYTAGDEAKIQPDYVIENLSELIQLLSAGY